MAQRPSNIFTPENMYRDPPSINVITPSSSSSSSSSAASAASSVARLVIGTQGARNSQNHQVQQQLNLAPAQSPEGKKELFTRVRLPDGFLPHSKVVAFSSSSSSSSAATLPGAHQTIAEQEASNSHHYQAQQLNLVLTLSLEQKKESFTKAILPGTSPTPPHEKVCESDWPIAKNIISQGALHHTQTARSQSHTPSLTKEEQDLLAIAQSRSSTPESTRAFLSRANIENLRKTLNDRKESKEIAQEETRPNTPLNQDDIAAVFEPRL